MRQAAVQGIRMVRAASAHDRVAVTTPERSAMGIAGWVAAVGGPVGRVNGRTPAAARSLLASLRVAPPDSTSLDAWNPTTPVLRCPTWSRRRLHAGAVKTVRARK